MVTTVSVSMPYERLVKEDCTADEYLINQLDGVNDNPPEDNLPLRQWLIRETHEALKKNPKTKSVVLRPKADKTCRTEFEIVVTGNE